MNFETFDKTLEKNEVKAQIKNMLKRIGALQYQMYAEAQRSLLIVFQGLDASGKDGLTCDLLKYCNPVGIAVKSFKRPTPEEAGHDFLWRVHQHTPAKGNIQIFIRSHYEDILVPTVDKYLPVTLIEQRFDLINHFERLLEHNGTKILKFFLNVSREVQEERLRERIEMQEKHWKHSDGDWETREKFDLYMNVYKTIFERCNWVPWYAVPSDTNWQKLYVVAKIVLQALEDMDLKWPELKSEKYG